MYITVKSIKRNLGFKGIEISDIVIALPMIILFIVLFCGVAIIPMLRH